MTVEVALFMSVVAIAFFFGITNGFTNGGGVVATVITTRALEPMAALGLVALSEVVGLLLLGQAVSKTLAQGIVIFPASVSSLRILSVCAAAFLGALIWNTSMWYLALPTSSSHAMIGGIAGAFVSAYGSQAIVWPMFIKIFIFLGMVPLIGVVVAILLSRGVYWVGEFLTPAAKRVFRWMEILSMAGVAMAHGSNDGQKCVAMVLMGWAGLMQGQAVRPLPLELPLFLSAAGMVLGVVFGSRRIIRTVGKRLYRVDALQGFSAGLSTFFLVGMSSLGGYPMSTTQVMSTAVLGAGVAVQPRDVRWNLVGEIGLAWLVTLPAAGMLAASFVRLAELIGGGF